MLEPCRAVLFDILDLERWLFDVYMELLAEHDSMRAAGGREDRNNHRRRRPGWSTSIPNPVCPRTITMPAIRHPWLKFIASNPRQISHTPPIRRTRWPSWELHWLRAPAPSGRLQVTTIVLSTSGNTLWLPTIGDVNKIVLVHRRVNRNAHLFER